jgi:hypothetical protein
MKKKIQIFVCATLSAGGPGWLPACSAALPGISLLVNVRSEYIQYLKMQQSKYLQNSTLNPIINRLIGYK